MAKKRPNLEVGQTIFVETVGFLSGDEPKEPKPYIVKKINTSSIFVGSSDSVIDIRFDKKTWTYRSLLGDMNFIWLSREEYWNSITEKEEAKKMRAKIQGELEHLSLDKLLELADWLQLKTEDKQKI